MASKKKIRNRWLVPDGTYLVKIRNVVRKTKGTRAWTVVVTKPVRGRHRSRFVNDILHFHGFASEDSMRDARRREQELLRACFGPSAQGSAGPELQGKVVRVTTSREWRSDKKKLTSTITSYERP